MNTTGRKLFFERLNLDGTRDLLCRVCFVSVGKNLTDLKRTVARTDHVCRVGDILRAASGNP